MPVREILVPYHMGRRGVSVGLGPLRIGSPSASRTIVVDAGERTGWEAVNAELERHVRATLAAGEFPLVLAGNCNSALGTVAAMDNPAVVWFDAHGDFNDEATTVSGALEGMSLTLVARRYVAEEAIVLAGFRDLDPGERARLDRSRVLQVPDARLESSPLPAGSVYVHIDLDVLDPSISPGVNFQAPGGLTEERLVGALAAVFERAGVRAAAIANHNPERDRRGLTQRLARRLIGRIGEWVGTKELRRANPSR